MKMNTYLIASRAPSGALMSVLMSVLMSALMGMLLSMCLTLSMGLVNGCVAQTMPLNPYGQGDWKKLIESRGNAPLVVHFWGVTCGPCLSEMPQWGQWVAKDHGRVLFVQVDDVSVDITRNLAKKMKIDKAPNYFVRAKFDEFMRFEIDSKWSGEIPYTVTIDKTGAQRAYSGNTNFKTLQAWLKNNS
jgi:thiol-disulfide isomerase/thioredoxin